MKKYEELHATIKSMDGHEIRYFKLFAKRHVIGSRNTYMKLFDAMRKQEKSNDADLSHIFRKEDFIRNLPSAKLYLLRLINKSLYHFHDKEDALSVILRHIKLSELFFNKGEYLLAQSNLKKAKRVAEKDEAFVFSLLISELLLKLSVFSSDQQKASSDVKDEMLYEKDIFKKYLNLREYQHAFAKFKALEKTVFLPVTNTEKKQYDSILHQKIFSNPSEALSHKAEEIFYELKNSYQDKTKDKLQKKEITDDLLDFFIEYPQFFRKNAAAFINAIDEYLQTCRMNKDHKAFESGLKKFKSLQAPTAILRSQIVARTALLELRSSFEVGNISQLRSLAFDAENQLKKFESSIGNPLLQQVYYEVSACYFLMSKFRDALKWNLKSLSQTKLHPNEILFKKAQLLNFIIHFRLKNDDFLLSQLYSEKRKTGDHKSDPASIFIPILLKAGSRRTEPAINKEFEKLSKRRELSLYFNDYFLKQIFYNTRKPIF